MRKSLLAIIGGVLCAVSSTFSASAQDSEATAQDIYTGLHGYFRVQNAAQAAQDPNNGYVQVRGPFTAEPDQKFKNGNKGAAYDPATVLYINADWTQVQGQAVMRINNLRGQGIEVVGEPIDDYLGTLEEILFPENGFDDMEDALYSFVRSGYIHGYTSIGRALIQTLIYIVAARLDNENVPVEAKYDLATFADMFNKQVAANIDLSIYLEPAENDDYRIMFVTPNLSVVSNWYLNDADIQATFNKGFAAMRQYMGYKTGFTGEGLDPKEVAEMQSWGYDPTEKHKNYVDGYLLYTPYEEIFADPDLLFNWLKLNMIKFCDPERCPDIELQGIKLKEISRELQNHHLTQMLISYFPGAQQDQRIYLTDGKNGNVGKFDFTSEETAKGVLNSWSQWRIHPIDDNTNSGSHYFCLQPQAHDVDGYYASVYVDFPMKAVPNNNPEITTKFWVLSEKTETIKLGDYDYEYHPLKETATVQRQQPVLVEMISDNPENHLIMPVNDIIVEDKPSQKIQPTFGFSDDEWTVYFDGESIDPENPMRFPVIENLGDIRLSVLSFSSSNPEVATIEENGIITLVGEGETTITVSLEAGELYYAHKASYKLYVDKATSYLHYAETDIKIKKTDNFVQPELIIGEGIEDGEIFFNSDNDKAVSVDANGNMTIVGKGTATITAEFAGNSLYDGAVAYCTIEVEEPMVISDEIVGSQKAAARRAAAEEADSTYDDEVEQPHNDDSNTFKGILLSTSATNKDLVNAGIVTDENVESATAGVHLLSTQKINGADNLWYGLVENGATIPANSAFLVKVTGNEERVDSTSTAQPDMPGFPVKNLLENNTPTALDNIEVDGAMLPGHIYDLRGIEVTEPVSGNIYILNGQKILIK